MSRGHRPDEFDSFRNEYLRAFLCAVREVRRAFQSAMEARWVWLAASSLAGAGVIGAKVLWVKNFLQ